MHNLELNDNTDAAKYGRLLPQRLANLGAAVASLDHVTKSSEGRGRYALGAVHKVNALDDAGTRYHWRSPVPRYPPPQGGTGAGPPKDTSEDRQQGYHEQGLKPHHQSES